MAKKRSRIAYMPKSRRRSSKSESLSVTQTSTAAVDQTVQGQSEVESISAELAPSEGQNSKVDQSKNVIEEVISPKKNNSKLKKYKRRSTSIVYKPQSRRTRSAQSQSSVISFKIATSVQGKRKIGENRSPEDVTFENSSSSGEKKDKKRTKYDKERTRSVKAKDSDSGKKRPYREIQSHSQSSRNSGDVDDSQTSSEETVQSVEAKNRKAKRTIRKSTKIAYTPKSSSKVSKKKKQKLSDNSLSEKEADNLNLRPKRQRNKSVVHKKTNFSGDTSTPLETSNSKGQKNNSLVGDKPPKKKSKQALQVKSISTVDQDTSQKSKVDETMIDKRKTRQKNQRKEIPDRIQDMSVTKKAYSKWKPLSSCTKDHVKDVVDSSVVHVMNVISSKGSTKEDAQKHLETLKQRIFTSLHSIKGPIHLGDYSKMEKQLAELEDSILLNNNQVEALEKELVVQKRLLEDEQEKLQTLTSGGSQIAGNDFHIDRTKLHHLLQSEPVNTLNLPQLPKESLERPLPKISSEIKEISAKLSQTVKSMLENAESLKVPQWLECLSQISDNLPGDSS